MNCQVHQFELEIQNEDLRVAQIRLIEAHAKYFDLYEFAPVGYLMVDDCHKITQANHAATKLLGVDRSLLIGVRLERFIAAECRDDLYLHLAALAASTTLAFGTTIHRADGSRRVAHIESVAIKTGGSNVFYSRRDKDDVTAR